MVWCRSWHNEILVKCRKLIPNSISSLNPKDYKLIQVKPRFFIRDWGHFLSLHWELLLILPSDRSYGVLCTNLQLCITPVMVKQQFFKPIWVSEQVNKYFTCRCSDHRQKSYSQISCNVLEKFHSSSNYQLYRSRCVVHVWQVRLFSHASGYLNLLIGSKMKYPRQMAIVPQLANVWFILKDNWQNWG